MSVGNQADRMFLDALMYLGKSGQEYGIKNQMDQINQRAQEIQSTMTDEVERRNALRALAVQSQTAIAGSGGSATQVAAIQNLIPPMPNSVAQAMLQGQLTGDNQMVKVANDMIKRDEDGQIRMLDRKAAYELKLKEMELAARKQMDPEILATKKENRKEFASLRALRDKSQQQIAELVKLQKEVGRFGTGPENFLNFSARAQALDSQFAKLNLEVVNSMNSVRSIDTGPERQILNNSLPSITKWTASNKQIIQDRINTLRQAKQKADTAIQSYELTGGMSFESFDASEVKPNSPKGVILDKEKDPFSFGIKREFE